MLHFYTVCLLMFKVWCCIVCAFGWMPVVACSRCVVALFVFVVLCWSLHGRAVLMWVWCVLVFRLLCVCVCASCCTSSACVARLLLVVCWCAGLHLYLWLYHCMYTCVGCRRLYACMHQYLGVPGASLADYPTGQAPIRPHGRQPGQPFFSVWWPTRTVGEAAGRAAGQVPVRWSIQLGQHQEHAGTGAYMCIYDGNPHMCTCSDTAKGIHADRHTNMQQGANEQHKPGAYHNKRKHAHTPMRNHWYVLEISTSIHGSTGSTQHK